MAPSSFRPPYSFFEATPLFSYPSRSRPPVLRTHTHTFRSCKCERYWPEKVGQKQTHANFEIELASETQTCPQYFTSK